MWERLREGWKELKEGEPGRRFQDRHRKHRDSGGVRRWWLPIAGAAVIAVGLVLLPAPGPGLIVVAIGAGMVAKESAWASKALDNLEVWIRAALRVLARAWRSAHTAAKALVLVAISGVLALVVALVVHGVSRL